MVGGKGTHEMLVLGPRPDGDLIPRGLHVGEASVAHPTLELRAGARVALEVARGLQEGGDPFGDGDCVWTSLINSATQSLRSRAATQ